MQRLMPTVLILVTTLPLAQADDWPQWFGPQRDGIWRETGILEKFPEGGPRRASGTRGVMVSAPRPSGT
jgi:hypothetical protein